MSLLLIGGGNMGGAIAASVIDAKLVQPEDLTIVEADQEKREALSFKLHCHVLGSIDKKQVVQADVILLAMKPQSFKECALTLALLLEPHQVVVSIMAGVSLETLSQGLNDHKQLIRAMPNLPARVGKAMTVLTASADVTAAARDRVLSIFDTIGEALFVDNEDLIDAATAVSGSGPGFLFEILEGFVAGATKLGFTEDQARTLVSATFLGAIELWRNSGQTPRSLKNEVASKGGTTQAGLDILSKKEVSKDIVAAIEAAYKRAKALAQ